MVGDSAYVDIVGASGIRLIIETDPENPSGGERGPAPEIAGGVFASPWLPHACARPALRCGRVEVQYKGGNPDYFDAPNGLSEGIWGTVCNDGFDDAEAEVSRCAHLHPFWKCSLVLPKSGHVTYMAGSMPANGNQRRIACDQQTFIRAEPQRLYLRCVVRESG